MRVSDPLMPKTRRPPKPSKSPASPKFLSQLAKKHAVSEEAVAELFAALQRGGGSMAQFSHPDLGGTGQWMPNGMVMVGDMFNRPLKEKVDALGRDLLPHLQTSARSAPRRDAPADATERLPWWPKEFKSRPAATGGQNDFRYAYFPEENALVVERRGETITYDTSGHDLHGFGQQQVSSSGFTLRSAQGTLDLSELPRRQARRRT